MKKCYDETSSNTYLRRGCRNARRRAAEDCHEAQVNGLYTNRWSDFRILALGHNKLRVQFNGEYRTRSGMPNLGIADGEASIDGNVATFIPGDTTSCKITLTFLRNRLKVDQEGSDADCGFGHNVFATGTYRRIKAGKPKIRHLSMIRFAPSDRVS